MKVLPFRAPDEVTAAVRPVAEVVATGGVVLIPSESFYGLAADPRSAAARKRVDALKGRPSELGLPVLCADWQQLESLVVVPERFRVKLSRVWPAALTVVLPAKLELAAARGATLAVRIPAHRELRALLYRVGPLTGTSANRHGASPCTTADDALRSLAGMPELALDQGPTAGGLASTLVDLTGAEVRVLRAGPVPWEDPCPEC
ncbi:MAG TPA: L-threonylcarbamoyladenylate synthase [Chondromyces sp.]|nr:L-threonylcarbamoyladenylate synthase [Chondromyces sp.]